ncbi:MAG: thioredoxin family protein [Cellvibrionaceae bacterium]
MLLDTPKIERGWQAAPFQLATADGKHYSLEELQGEKGTLIAFICNHCPYVKAIAERFAKDAETLNTEGIKVIAINANDYNFVPEDSPEMMLRFAEKFNFSFPYLVDEDQSVARTYDAVCTPDFFGFNANNELQYRGRLDDAQMGDPSNRVEELVIAMKQIAQSGQGPDTQHPSMGCSIKWR